MMKKKYVYTIISIAIVIVIAIILLICIQSRTKSGYISICDFNFNDKSSGVSEMKAENWLSENGASFYYDEKGGMDGTGCLVISAKNKDDARYVYTYDDAQENTYYRMSVWLKTENVGYFDNSVGANISVLNTSEKSIDYKGSNDWEYIEYYGKTGDNQKSFKVCLRLGFYSGVNSGTVYFDDFKLEQLDELPANTVFTSMVDTMSSDNVSNVKEVPEYKDSMLTATILILFTLGIFVIAYRYMKKSNNKELNNELEIDSDSKLTFLSEVNTKNSIFILILLGFALRLFMSVTMPQCDIDVNLFQYWGNKAVEYGIFDFYSYAEEINCDYPPLFIYYLYLMGLIGKALDITQTVAYDVLLKLPAIIADCIIAYMIYKISTNKMNKVTVIFVVSLWLFNPLVILDSACWGQVDSILALFIFAAVYFITKEDFILSALSIAFAIALKPQGLFIVPILGFALLRKLIREKDLTLKERLLPFLHSIIAFLGSFLAIMIPFGIKMKPNIFMWIFNTYLGTAGGYKYATVNSFDFFYLFGGNWVSDSEPFIGNISYFTAGMAFVVIICLIIGALYIIGEKKDTNIYLLSATMIFAVTMFAPRMHERYFYPSIILLLAAVICSNNKLLLGIYGFLSINGFYTVFEILIGITIGGELLDTDYTTAAYYYWPPINGFRGLLAVCNVAGAVMLLTISVLMVIFKENRNKKLFIWEHKVQR